MGGPGALAQSTVAGPPSRLVDLVEHELPGDAGLGTEILGRSALEGCHHLLDHLIEEDSGQLGVQQGAELEGDLGRRGGVA